MALRQSASALFARASRPDCQRPQVPRLEVLASLYPTIVSFGYPQPTLAGTNNISYSFTEGQPSPCSRRKRQSLYGSHRQSRWINFDSGYPKTQ